MSSGPVPSKTRSSKKPNNNTNNNTRPNQRPRRKNGRVRSNNTLQLHGVQHGAYQPMQNYTIRPGTTPGGMRVSGREMVSTLSSVISTAFAVIDTFELNPVSFARLNAFAPVYEQFFFHQARFIFQPAQPVTTAGVLMVGVDYDATDTAPATATALMRNATSIMTNVYADAACELNSGYSRLRRYNCVEGGTPDKAQINQAVVYIATESVSTAVQPGYLLVEYDVEFYVPQ